MDTTSKSCRNLKRHWSTKRCQVSEEVEQFLRRYPKDRLELSPRRDRQQHGHNLHHEASRNPGEVRTCLGVDPTEWAHCPCVLHPYQLGFQAKRLDRSALPRNDSQMFHSHEFAARQFDVSTSKLLASVVLTMSMTEHGSPVKTSILSYGAGLLLPTGALSS